MIRVIGPRDSFKEGEEVVNTTSRSRIWSRGLSPFVLGPIKLYEGAVVSESYNMENAWQYSKVYREFSYKGGPTKEYFEWAKEGFLTERAVRYPRGKGRKPLYTWWGGQKLSYIEARKQVYVPLYTRAVLGTKAFSILKDRYFKLGEITLWDFDGYDHLSLGVTLQEVLNNPKRKMGHAFILAYLLQKLYEREKLSKTS